MAVLHVEGVVVELATGLPVSPVAVVVVEEEESEEEGESVEE